MVIFADEVNEIEGNGDEKGQDKLDVEQREQGEWELFFVWGGEEDVGSCHLKTVGLISESVSSSFTGINYVNLNSMEVVFSQALYRPLGHTRLCL